MTPRIDFEHRLAQTGKHIDELIANTEGELKDERQNLKERWDTLDTRRKEAEYDSGWDDLKDELESEWGDVKDSYEDLKHRLSDEHGGHNH